MQNAFKSIFKPTLITSVGLAVLLTLGCAAKGYRFANTKPVLHMDDIRPIPVPASTEYDPIRYYFNSMVRLPVHKTLGGAPSKLAGDVNALDQVPASSWYTPRLGYHFLSPDQLLAGPIEHGPPQKPVTVVKAKIGGGNPGFIVSDLRGILYLIKFDPPSAPALETTTALIVSRLFWGFGYNVPEDYLFYFRPEDLHIAPDSELTRDDIQTILGLVASPILGRYRSTASRFIEGTILGPIAATGVRQDDPNDTIPHQDRRVMRALRVFAAFTNHSDIRPDNTLDAYVGPKDQGHVRHYLLDFGEAFGGHGMEHQRLWDGYTFMFSLKEAALNGLSLGLTVDAWEHIDYTLWPSIGAFESTLFQPTAWKEVFSYEPIRQSRDEDNYWAAKIVGAVTREHIEKLVEAADYPEPGSDVYIVDTLMERRRKILEAYLYKVTPLDDATLLNGYLHLRDISKVLLETSSAPTTYEFKFYSNDNQEVAPMARLYMHTPNVRVAVPDFLVDNADGYLRVEATLLVAGHTHTRPAQFHIRRAADGQIHLVGVVH